MIKQQYSEIAKKFTLPDYSILNLNFEISSIEEDDFLLREIRRKMIDKFSFYIKILEDLMQPDSSFSCLHECRALSESEKDNIFSLYSELMSIDRESAMLSVSEDDEKTASFILSSFERWQQIKPRLISLLEKLKFSWSLEAESGEKVRYFG